MIGKCIKVYVKDEEHKLLSIKAEYENLTLSTYMKRQGLRENRDINTKVVNEFCNLTKDFQELLLEYDVSDKYLEKIYKRIDIICQNL